MIEESCIEKNQPQECFMCTQYREGCLECRTHRLLSDIRSGMYDKMGLDQNRREWEERAIKSEEREMETDKMTRMDVQHDHEDFGCLWQDCGKCEEGMSHHDCGEDTCCCLNPIPNVLCDVCDGNNGSWICEDWAKEKTI